MKATSRFWRRRRTTSPDARSAPLRDTHLTHAESPVRIGITAQMPSTMPRAEDDVATRAGSRDFHDQLGSGRDTANRGFYF